MPSWNGDHEHVTMTFQNNIFWETPLDLLISFNPNCPHQVQLAEHLDSATLSTAAAHLQIKAVRCSGMQWIQVCPQKPSSDGANQLTQLRNFPWGHILQMLQAKLWHSSAGNKDLCTQPYWSAKNMRNSNWEKKIKEVHQLEWAILCLSNAARIIVETYWMISD
jgi:hypothetical protein